MEIGGILGKVSLGLQKYVHIQAIYDGLLQTGRMAEIERLFLSIFREEITFTVLSKPPNT